MDPENEESNDNGKNQEKKKKKKKEWKTDRFWNLFIFQQKKVRLVIHPHEMTKIRYDTTDFLQQLDWIMENFFVDTNIRKPSPAYYRQFTYMARSSIFRARPQSSGRGL